MAPIALSGGRAPRSDEDKGSMEINAWITWGFQGLLGLLISVLGLFISKLWTALEKNTDAINNLQTTLAKEYMPRSESERHHKDIHDSIHRVREQIQPLIGTIARIDERTQLAPVIKDMTERLNAAFLRKDE